MRDNKPVNLVLTPRETLYSERRDQHKGKFFDNSKGKVGKQKLGINIQFMDAIREDWQDRDLI
jgi:hypothetical protein